MLAGLQRLDRRRDVRLGDRQVEDDLDLRVGQQLVGRHGAGDAVLLCRRPGAAEVEVGAGDHLDGGEVLAHRQILLADRSGAEAADFDGLHKVSWFLAGHVTPDRVWVDTTNNGGEVCGLASPPGSRVDQWYGPAEPAPDRLRRNAVVRFGLLRRHDAASGRYAADAAPRRDRRRRVSRGTRGVERPGLPAGPQHHPQRPARPHLLRPTRQQHRAVSRAAGTSRLAVRALRAAGPLRLCRRDAAGTLAGNGLPHAAGRQVARRRLAAPPRLRLVDDRPHAPRQQRPTLHARRRAGVRPGRLGAGVRDGPLHGISARRGATDERRGDAVVPAPEPRPAAHAAGGHAGLLPRPR